LERADEPESPPDTSASSPGPGRTATVTITLAGHTLGHINLHRASSGRVTFWLPTTSTLTIKASGSVTLDGVAVER
jgi:hypothetical protein